MNNKTSDKNVVNIEDDVKILKELIQDIQINFEGGIENRLKDFEIKAIQNILSEREQMLKEKQDYKQDIKDFQNALNEENLRCANYAIENNELKKRIQELEEERDHWHGCFIVAMENGIAKEKVIDKIKELKNNIKNGNTRYPYIEEHKIEILEELLGGEGK